MVIFPPSELAPFRTGGNLRVEAFQDKGFREVIRDRDRPWADYGERPG
jgi:hypothetical protein